MRGALTLAHQSLNLMDVILNIFDVILGRVPIRLLNRKRMRRNIDIMLAPEQVAPTQSCRRKSTKSKHQLPNKTRIGPRRGRRRHRINRGENTRDHGSKWSMPSATALTSSSL